MTSSNLKGTYVKALRDAAAYIKDVSEVKVKSLRAAQWGTQMAIAVVPFSYI